MSRVLRTKRKTLGWSPGLLTAGALVYFYWLNTEHVTWWIIGIAIVLSLIIDVLIYGSAREDVITLDKE